MKPDSNSGESDWRKLIEAQTEASKRIEAEEKGLNQLGRKLYKEELDNQLTYKLNSFQNSRLSQ